MTGYQVFRNTLIIMATFALAYVFLLTLHIWIILLVAVLIASALRPYIMRLKDWRVQQGLAILIVYGTLTFVTITMLVAVLPPIVNQFAGFLENEDRLANRIIAAQTWTNNFISQNMGSDIELEIAPDEIRTAVRDFVQNLRVNAPSLINEFGNFASDFVLILVMGIYWITSRERAEKFLVELLPLTRQSQARAILDEIESGLGSYVRGILLVSIVVGIISFIILTVLRVPGAATLSFVYALATAIPIVGGFIGMVMATALAVLTSPAAGAATLIVTIFLQQIENYFISPRVMSKSSDFDEILVIVFIAAGFTLNGIAGGLLAIPVAGTVAILLKHLVFEPRKARVIPRQVDGGILLRETDPEDQPPPSVILRP